MAQRLSYRDLAVDGYAAMSAVEHYLNTGTGLEPGLLELVRLLASLRNGCQYCIGLHTFQAKKHNETDDRVARVATWRESDLYTHRERAAFAWTDIVTNIQTTHATDEEFAEAREHFSEVDLVNLTMTITSINSWNRMAIAFRAERRTAPEPEQAKTGTSWELLDDGGKVSVESME